MDCQSCPYGQPPQPAVYLWTAQPSGDEFPVCVECCAYWRSIARDDPDLGPWRIQQIDEKRVASA